MPITPLEAKLTQISLQPVTGTELQAATLTLETVALVDERRARELQARVGELCRVELQEEIESDGENSMSPLR